MSKESAYFTLTNVDGKHDAKHLKRELAVFPGVISVSVNTEKNSVAVDFDNTGASTEQFVKQMERLGYQITHQKNEEHVM